MTDEPAWVQKQRADKAAEGLKHVEGEPMTRCKVCFNLGPYCTCEKEQEGGQGMSVAEPEGTSAKVGRVLNAEEIEITRAFNADADVSRWFRPKGDPNGHPGFGSIPDLLATIDAMHAELARHSECVDCQMVVDW